ncbi:MAG: glycogen synthase GlgA [Caulobacteraceae bacterium]
MTQIDVLAVASELYPLLKTGGLADVTGALPAALKEQHVRVRTMIPGYPAVLSKIRRAKQVHAFDELFGGPARLLSARHEGLDLLVLDAPHRFDRPGGPYVGQDGRDYPDNAFRFAALARAAADVGLGALADFKPNVVHAHDWQTGLTAAYLHYDAPVRRPATVMTVHNLAFQGQFARELLAPLGLPPASFSPDGVEYYGDIGFLKAGLRLSDHITTVSPNYAAEICTAEGGMGLDGLLRGRADRLSGILNGIDVGVWNTWDDPFIPATYGPDDLSPRGVNKAEIQARFGLDVDPRAPLFFVVSRLSWQKGLDLLLEAIPALVGEGAQLAVLGTGDPALRAGFLAAHAAHPSQVGCIFDYDENLAHLLQAGGDALLAPSRFEPCGLTQLCALRYGAVPVVSRVGGLADTVIDASPMAIAAGSATGVQLASVQPAMLETAIRRTVALYREPGIWRRLQANGMTTDVSWREPARAYAALYRNLVAEREG